MCLKRLRRPGKQATLCKPRVRKIRRWGPKCFVGTLLVPSPRLRPCARILDPRWSSTLERVRWISTSGLRAPLYSKRRPLQVPSFLGAVPSRERTRFGKRWRLESGKLPAQLGAREDEARCERHLARGVARVFSHSCAANRWAGVPKHRHRAVWRHLRRQPAAKPAGSPTAMAMAGETATAAMAARAQEACMLPTYQYQVLLLSRNGPPSP